MRRHHFKLARPRTLSGLDGSGNLLIENVGGDVIVTDGSGDMDVRNVTGSFTVETDGSGSIYATDIADRRRGRYRGGEEPVVS